MPGWVLAKLSNILVSIDRGEATTDGYRGRGIWRQVIRYLGLVRGQVDGSITARVPWGHPDTSFEELDRLASASGTIDYLY